MTVRVKELSVHGEGYGTYVTVRRLDDSESPSRGLYVSASWGCGTGRYLTADQVREVISNVEVLVKAVKRAGTVPPVGMSFPDYNGARCAVGLHGEDVSVGDDFGEATADGARTVPWASLRKALKDALK